MSREPPIIDHNPHEKRQPWWLWWAAWAFVALLWVLQIGKEFDLDQFFLGFMTAAVLVAWAMDLTGGEVPASWRAKPRRKG